MAVFYRAVSVAEYDDIAATGVLRAGPNSVEGKHLVATVGHARAFASMLYGEKGHTIISVEVSDTAAERFFHLPKLDGVGPAWFAELVDLQGALVRRVMP